MFEISHYIVILSVKLDILVALGLYLSTLESSVGDYSSLLPADLSANLLDDSSVLCQAISIDSLP